MNRTSKKKVPAAGKKKAAGDSKPSIWDSERKPGGSRVGRAAPEPEIVAFTLEVRRDLDPVGPVEESIAQVVAQILVQRSEVFGTSECIQKYMTLTDMAPALLRLQRYAESLDNSLATLLGELRLLQQARRSREAARA